MLIVGVVFVVLSNDLTIEEVIKQHRAEIIKDAEKTHRITVRRSHIFEDAIDGLHGFDEGRQIRVTFLNEPAVDDGGLRREFFMLLMGDIGNNSSLLDGPSDRRILRHNTSDFQVSH